MAPEEVRVMLAGEISESRVISSLPYLFQHESSSLRTYYIRVKIPEPIIFKSESMGLFSPQILHGADYYLNGHAIHQDPGSNPEIRYAWYRPLWLSLPKALMNDSGDNFVDIRMHAFQRGFIVPSMYIAPWEAGSQLYRTYNFLSNTLADATNLFSWLAGLFLICIWLFSGSASGPGRLFAFAGSSTLLWATLFTLALWPELPMSAWKLWRFSLYVLTGGLVFLMSLFLFEYAKTAISRRVIIFSVFLIFFPPLIFLIAEKSTEFFLDIYWTGAVITLYVIAIGNLIIKRWGRFDALTMALLVHSIIATIFAYHDYAVQSGPMLLERRMFLDWGIPPVFLEPIYLSHLTLPTLLIISGVILVRHHIRNLALIKDSNIRLKEELDKREHELSIVYARQEKIIHENAVNQERNRILQDIHDGLGSKLINIVIELRSGFFKLDDLLLDVQSCIDDLRILVNGQSLSETSLSVILEDMVQRAWRNLASINCRLSYRFDSIDPVQISNDTGLAILRICQEMISNIIKHAQASEACIQLVWSPLRDHLILEISDNGIGFSVESLQLHMKRGMKGIHKRLEDFSSHFRLTSQPGITHLIAHFPLQQSA